MPLLSAHHLLANLLCMIVISVMVRPSSCPSSVTAPLMWAALSVYAGACLLAVTCARQHLCALLCVDSAGRSLSDAEVQVLVAELLYVRRAARADDARRVPAAARTLALPNLQEDSSDEGEYNRVRSLLHLDVAQLSTHLRLRRMFCIYAATQTAVVLLGRALGVHMVPPAVRQTLGPECLFHDSERARSEYEFTLAACFAISFGVNIIFEIVHAMQESYDIIKAFEQSRALRYAGGEDLDVLEYETHGAPTEDGDGRVDGAVGAPRDDAPGGAGHDAEDEKMGGEGRHDGGGNMPAQHEHTDGYSLQGATA